MRLGVYSDFAYRRTARGLETDQAFVLFVAALAAHADVTVLGRLDRSAEPWHHRVPEPIGFVALPHYAALSKPAAVARGTIGTGRALWRALDRLDAVWLLGPHPFAILFAVLALLRRRRVVLGVRQDLPAYARHRHPGRPALLAAALALEAVWRALGLVLPVVAVGPDLARRYRFGRRVLAAPISLVSRADLAEPRPWPEPPVVLSVGRLDAEKNPLLLADILAELGTPWRMVVCGEGALAEALEARMRRLGVADRCELRGYVPVDAGLREAYRSAGAFLHVSWTEGFPQVLLEAFAAGLPVVATDVGAVRALAGDAALLIEPGDAAAAASALVRLREEPELRQRLSEAGLALVAGQTVETVAARVAGLLVGNPRAEASS